MLASSSNFLISQSALKIRIIQLVSQISALIDQIFKRNLLDNVVAAVIVGDISLAEKISDEILLQDPNNQEAYIGILTYFYQNGKFREIDKILKK